MNKVYEIVTEKILEQLEKGACKWRMPWKPGEAPQNLISKKAYRGINALLLANLPYKTPFYASFKQVKDAGGMVKAGAKGHTVIYWHIWEDKEEKQHFTPFYYHVFNLEQTTLEIPKLEEGEKHNPIEEAEKVFTEYQQREAGRPELIHKDGRAFFSEGRQGGEVISIPPLSSFHTPEAYYETLFHEAAHSTGTKGRLNRDCLEHYKGQDRGKEELIAEMTAGFLCAHTGIQNEEREQQQAAYCKSWLGVLKNNKQWIISSAQHAQKAADFILYGKKAPQGKEAASEKQKELVKA